MPLAEWMLQQEQVSPLAVLQDWDWEWVRVVETLAPQSGFFFESAEARVAKRKACESFATFIKVNST